MEVWEKGGLVKRHHTINQASSALQNSTKMLVNLWKL